MFRRADRERESEITLIAEQTFVKAVADEHQDQNRRRDTEHKE